MSTLDEQQKAIQLARRKFHKSALELGQARKESEASEEFKMVELLGDAWETLQALKSLREIKRQLEL